MHLAGGAEVHEPRRHLRAPGVLDADEQDLGDVLHDHPFCLSERLQPLAREAMGEHWHEHVDPGVAKQVERLRDIALDRLLREDARELVGQRFGGLAHVVLGDRVEYVHRGLPWRLIAVDVDLTEDIDRRQYPFTR